jgi:histidine ammonia-lyase
MSDHSTIHPGHFCTAAGVKQFISSRNPAQLSAEAAQQISACRQFLDDHLRNASAPIYGINTGFGSLCNTEIGKDDLQALQEKLVMSHACGTGSEVPADIVRTMLYLKALGLSKGYSGVQVETVDRLLWMLNNDVLPVVYTQGSLGASGDLAPLAHLSLPLIGRGHVRWKGEKHEASVVLTKLGVKPLVLQSKEGIALLNGTQFMSAYATQSVARTQELADLADLIACISLEAFHGTVAPFHPTLHQIRPHAGQITVSNRIRHLLKGSAMQMLTRPYVQDPYSFRCIPQVHGAIRDTLDHVTHVVETEINSVTDNPTIFPDEGLVVSGGNFHGQPLAMALDFLAVALAELGSISERRTYKLISGTRGLPAFLTAEPGLNSGMMIPQYAAASIVSRNKQLATPCSVDTIDSSNGQEDHVSMGANAAVRTMEVLENVERVMAIELLCACQALEFRRPEHSSEHIENFVLAFRKHVAPLKEDRELYRDIESAIAFIRSGF